MSKKALSVKLPHNVYLQMIDNGQLNPAYVVNFIKQTTSTQAPDYNDLTRLNAQQGVIYTIKVECDLIDQIRSIAQAYNSSIVKITYYLFENYYRKEDLTNVV